MAKIGKQKGAIIYEHPLTSVNYVLELYAHSTLLYFVHSIILYIQYIMYRYMLSLRMLTEDHGKVVSDTVGTVWGFQGVPRRKSVEQNHFRWFQVH